MDTSMPKSPLAGVIITFFTCLFIYTGLGALLALLLLYLKVGIGLSPTHSIAINSAFLALLYSSSVVGGYLGGRYSYKNTIFFGLLSGFIALIAIAAKNIYIVELGLALFIICYGFSLPNLMCFLGQLFTKEDKRRGSSFTAVYVAMNAGAIISMASSGFLAEYFSFNVAFIIFSVSMLLAFIIFLFGYRHYSFLPETVSYKQANKNGSFKGFIPALIFTIILAPILMVLLKYAVLSNYFIILISVVVFIWVFVLAGKLENPQDAKNTRLYIVLLLVSVVFWILYMLQPSAITLFIKYNVDKTLFGLAIPATSFYSLNPMFILILGSLFAVYCAKSKFYNNIPTINKFILGIIITGLGYIILFPAVLTANSLGMISVWWIVLTYLMQTSGEIIIGPTAYAMVGELVPTKLEGIMMGLRQVTMGLGGALSMFVASATLSKGGLSTNPIDTNPRYAHTFLLIGGITILIGLLVFLFSQFFQRRSSKI